MRTRFFPWAAALLPALGACSTPSISDLLSLQVVSDSPVEVDSLCTEGACAPAEVAVDLTLADDAWLSDQAVVRVVQYRVDYVIAGIDEEVPFFAAPTSVEVAAGATTAWVAIAAGNTQRQWVFDRAGGTELQAEATLSVAGYDHNSVVVEASTPFDLAFVNLAEDPGDDPADTAEENP